MMLEINGTDIRMTRGNTAYLDITPLNEGGQPIVLDDGDRVIFKVKSPFGETKLTRILDSSCYTDAEDTSVNLLLIPDDTLSMRTGLYLYDCILIFADGQAYTFISESHFELMPAIATVKDVDADG